MHLSSFQHAMYYCYCLITQEGTKYECTSETGNSEGNIGSSQNTHQENVRRQPHFTLLLLGRVQNWILNSFRLFEDVV